MLEARTKEKMAGRLEKGSERQTNPVEQYTYKHWHANRATKNGKRISTPTHIPTPNGTKFTI